MPGDWKQWVGSVIDNDIPLLEYAGESATSAVFATQFLDKKAAIKLIAVDAATVESRLANLQVAEKLSHPHLLSVLKSGRCQLAGQDLLFIVTEFADENLSQVLPERALTAAETRELLTSTLDALSYLHSHGLVHGGLRPSNVMAAGELLKLSCADVQRAGEPSGKTSPEPYDAPEASRALSPASDIWALGIMLVEVMTQHVPAGFKKELDALPSPFREIAPRCLAHHPAQRATLAEISEYLNPKKVPEAAVSAATATNARGVRVPQREFSKRVYTALALVVVVIGAIVAIPKLSMRPPVPSEEAQVTRRAAETKSPPKRKTQRAKEPTPAAQGVKPSAAVNAAEQAQTGEPESIAGSYEGQTRAASKTEPDISRASANNGIVRRVIPNVPRSASDTIQGTVRVRLKVQVNPSGDVTGTEFVIRGPSKYFANLAEKAARDWKFVPAGGARAWNLQFDFRRTGTSVLPSEVNR